MKFGRPRSKEYSQYPLNAESEVTTKRQDKRHYVHLVESTRIQKQ